MDTLDHIVKKYGIDLNQSSPHLIDAGRFKDIPRLFVELGFKVGAEVGVWQGDYSKWLFRMMPGLKLYMIDAWVPYRGYKDFRSGSFAPAYQMAQDNVKGRNAVIMKAWSVDAAKEIEDGSLDFVFIDGNHSYEECVQDIALWSPKVRKGGIVYGHDYDDYSSKSRWKGMNVINAVNGWVKSYKIDPLLVFTRNKNKCWMYVKD